MWSPSPTERKKKQIVTLKKIATILASKSVLVDG
jgi:hypothetical protein